MTPKQALAFVRRHGIALQAARGPAPSLAEEIAGGPIRLAPWSGAMEKRPRGGRAPGGALNDRRRDGTS